MEKELTPKQQTSEAVRQAENILIIAGQHPTVDQVSAVMGLGMILRKFGKKVSTVISDDVPAGVKFLPMSTIDRKLGGLRDFVMRVDLARAEVDKLKYTLEDGKLNVHITPFSGTFASQDVSFDYGPFQYDIVLVLGVAAHGRMDRIYSQNADQLRDVPLINIDFHRSNEQYGAINLIDGNAASLGEILVALSESLQTGLIDAEIATVMLTGIMSATDRFTATHTTSKALTVAAQMMAAGADQQKVVKGLYKDKPREQQKPVQSQKPSQPQTPRNNDANRASQPGSSVQPQTGQSASPATTQNSTDPVAQPAVANPEAAKVLSTLQQLKNPAILPAEPAGPAALVPATQPDQPRSLIAGGKLENGQMPSQMAVQQPQVQGEPVVEPVLEELLPPQHIEISEYEYQGDETQVPEINPAQTTLVSEPEPLINYAEPAQPEQPPRAMTRGVNPANLTYFQS